MAWEIAAFGTGIQWPELDEDIGVAGLLGIPEDLVEEAAGSRSVADRADLEGRQTDADQRPLKVAARKDRRG